jgi:ketosteroid isomerase-like protein
VAGAPVTSFQHRNAEDTNQIQKIEHLLETLERGVEQRDSTQLAEIYCENAVALFTGLGAPVRGRIEILDTWSRHLSRWSRVELIRRDTVVRIRGEVAWGTFLWDGNGCVGQQGYRVEGERWSVVCVRENGIWLFAQTHTSLPYSDWESHRTDA